MVRAVRRLTARFRRKPERKTSLRAARPVDYGFARQACFAALRPLVEKPYGWDEALQDGLFARQFVQGEVQIVTLDGRDAGWLQWRQERGALHLVRLCLAQAFRGQGLGRIILERLQARAKQSRKPILLSLARIDPSLGFYLKTGFRVVEVEPYRVHLRYRPRLFRRAFGPTPGMTRG